jgi:hypothetical protein
MYLSFLTLNDGLDFCFIIIIIIIIIIIAVRAVSLDHILRACADPVSG